jgi:DtxR family transcriptional regulator, Mn-dependent transcriptional regulator
MEHISGSLEDYLEAIYQIAEKSRVARVKDISQRLGVKSASVVGALRALRSKGLIDQERYGYIKLTKPGERVAEDVLGRHQALSSFFSHVLGLDAYHAEDEACSAEHCLGEETISRLVLLQEFLTCQSREKNLRLKQFNGFLKSRKAKVK